MKFLTTFSYRLRIWKDTCGQDLIEYALMAGFLAVSAGAIVPGIAESLKTIYGRINNVVSSSAAQN